MARRTLALALASAAAVASGLAGASGPAAASAARWPGLSGPAPAQAVRHGSCAPLRVLRPSRQLRPLTASNAQLAASGLPTRPPASAVRATAIWEIAVTHARRWVAPDPVCTSLHRAPTPTTAWAGHVVPNSLYGGKSFGEVSAQWTQPAVRGDAADPRPTARTPIASFWVGIQGSKDLIQAGSDSVATKKPRYRFWTEDYPKPLVYEGPAIHAGDKLLVQVKYLGHKKTSYFLENVTDGTFSDFTNGSPYVQEQQADFLNECDGAFLPKYQQMTFSDNVFFSARGKEFSLTGGRNVAEYMTSNGKASGKVMAVTSAVGADHSFTDTWRSSPHANKCPT
jgi:Peptidase A4 family